MPSTTQCPNCGVVLNLPPGAEGRRLRCPKCANRFVAGQPDTRPPSSAPGVAEAGLGSSSYPVRSAGDLIPTAEGDLRETFDLPMMMEAEPAPVARPRGSADAVGLFQNEDPVPRRPTAAQARGQARKCPTCGTIVPVGMSLCSFCGLDLDTGIRVGIEDELDDIPPPSRRQSIPLGVGILGGVSLFVSLLLLIISLFQWMSNREGYEFLALVCAFGMFASVQFVRGKSVKLLLIAYSLGALIDVVALIAVPVWNANNDEPTIMNQVVENANSDNDGAPVIRSYADRLDYNSIAWGIALLLVYAAVALYLSTPGVRRHIDRR